MVSICLNHAIEQMLLYVHVSCWYSAEVRCIYNGSKIIYDLTKKELQQSSSPYQRRRSS